MEGQAGDGEPVGRGAPARRAASGVSESRVVSDQVSLAGLPAPAQKPGWNEVLTTGYITSPQSP